MPLPPALAARLAKRGLLNRNEPAPEPVPATAEEVIAEDYDDDNIHSTYHLDADLGRSYDDDESHLIYECFACPNKSNPYHVCVSYCRQQWGVKSFRHDPTMDKKRERMLKRYPLPDSCVEVGDPDTGRYYYWNVETDEVSWLPPNHPRAKFTLPADMLKEKTNKNIEDRSSSTDTSNRHHNRNISARHVNSEGEESDLDDDNDDDDASADGDDEKRIDEPKDFKQMEKEMLKRKKQSEQDRGFVKKKKDVNLDPMDPAAYSDIPKGGWTSGLEGRGTAKTGADVTAAGPLFQQRPYPNPGAVLRMNEKK